MQDKKALPELQHVTDSLGGLLMSGLGRFGLRFEAPPQPHEHALVIIFVVGGITMREIRDVQVRVPGSLPVLARTVDVVEQGSFCVMR